MKVLRLQVCGHGKEETLTFRRFPVRIGRDETNDCQLAFALVSRFHARIDLNGDSLLLRDEGSSHGTFLAGQSAPLPALRFVDLSVAGGAIQIAALHLEAALLDDIDATRIFDQNATTDLHLEADPNATHMYDEEQVDPSALDADAVERLVTAGVDALARARAELTRTIKAASLTLKRDRRVALFDTLLAAHPELLHEEAFSAVVDKSAVRARVAPEADVALRGLQEISSLYVPYAPPLTQAESVAAFLGKLESTLRLLFESLAALRYAYRSEAALPTSPSGNADLAAQLLDWTRESSDARHALEQEFVDIATHHRRLVSEAVWGVERMLAELAPARIEQAVTHERGRLSLFRFRAQWEAYEYRFKRIVTCTASLRTIFGRTFAMAAAAVAGDKMPPPPNDDSGPREARGPRLAAQSAG
jgi:type VI secretion system protein ImpI